MTPYLPSVLEYLHFPNFQVAKDNLRFEGILTIKTLVAVSNTDPKRHHTLVEQVVKPFFSNELSVGCNVIYLYVRKDFSEFFEQFFALYVVRVWLSRISCGDISDLAPFAFTVRARSARTVNAKGARSELTKFHCSRCVAR
jgi:hypothetical protein